MNKIQKIKQKKEIKITKTKKKIREQNSIQIKEIKTKYMKVKGCVVYLDLLSFMKSGPCVRNFRVSPTKGQPNDPGGIPFLEYLKLFHFSSAKNAQNVNARA